MLIEELVYKKLEDLRSRIAENIKSSGQSASGMTAQSMVIKKEANRITLYGREFFGTLETGRKPGKVPPISNILNWLQSRGMQLEGSSNLRRAWGIATNISKFGTKLHQSGGRKDIYTNEIEKFKSEIYKEVKEALIVIVRDNLKR